MIDIYTPNGLLKAGKIICSEKNKDWLDKYFSESTRIMIFPNHDEAEKFESAYVAHLLPTEGRLSLESLNIKTTPPVSDAKEPLRSKFDMYQQALGETWMLVDLETYDKLNAFMKERGIKYQLYD